MTGRHGGARPGAGHLRKRFQLDLETARILRQITRVWQAERPEAHYTEERVLDDLIYREMLRRWGQIGSPEREHWLAIARGEEENQQ